MSTVFNNGQRLLDNNMKEAISYKCTCMAKLRISIRFRLIVWLQLQKLLQHIIILHSFSLFLLKI